MGDEGDLTAHKKLSPPASATVEDHPDALHDFRDDSGPVPAFRHPNGGGWVASSARVASSAYVGELAGVFGHAQLLDEGVVTDTAWLCGDAVVAGRARVGGDAVVEGNARILGRACVTDDAYVGGDAVLDGDDRADGEARIIATGHGSRTQVWSTHPDSAGDWDEPAGPDDSANGRLVHGWPGATVVSNRALRRLQGWELILVLAIFPLGSTLQGLVDLVQRIQTQQTVTSHDLPALNGPWLVVGFGFAFQIGILAAAGMVCYLLTRSGEGVRSINLGRSRWRMDLALYFRSSSSSCGSR